MPVDSQSEVIKEWVAQSPFIAFMRLELVSVDQEKNEIVMKMPLRPEFERGGPNTGQFHGGPVSALIDTVGDFAVALVTKGTVPTINFRVDFLRPSTGAYLVAKAAVRRAGRTVAVADVDVFDDQGRLTAIGRGCYSGQTG
jgi:uncharacterized protein (TIGR00369 family)